MAVSQTSSRLQLLQARFQRKQLQEKEQKLVQLYEQQQQRAHQVAQRGSAGSNGSDHSLGAAAEKVKQLFADERRQQNGVKGIDKSYPLEPLASKKPSALGKAPGRLANVANNNNMTNRKSNSKLAAGTRGATKAEANGNVSRESLAAASRRRESSSREYHARYSGEANDESIRQVNGHANNGYRYEINIDEVIDNEALQRNRMLAKFQPGDIERRRRQLSADIDDEFPPDTQYDVSSRKSSLKNAKSNPTIAATTKKTIPRKSTVMKTTQSAKMKVCNPPQNRSRLVMRRTSSLVPRKPKKVPEKPARKKSVEQPAAERCCEISERCFPPPWNSLKSTSLICEIIRKHSKLQRMRNKSKMGRVKTIVTKIENQTKPFKPTGKLTPVAKSIEKRLLEMTRDAEPAASTCQEPLDLLNANFVEALKAAESNELANVESASGAQETIEPANNPRRASAEDVNRVRRASFEQKRIMFELLLHRRQRVSRRNSVESALRHFDGIDDNDDSEAGADQTHASGGNRGTRGFERSTSAWTIRTSALAARPNRCPGNKILEARDSIELAKVPVMTNLPACKRKIILHSRKPNENDDAQRGAFQPRDRSSSPEVIVKLDCCVSSTAKPESRTPKKADSIPKVSDIKSVAPYPSPKSPDSNESKARSLLKSTSLKLLGRFAGSNVDVPSETDLPLAPTNSSVHVEAPAAVAQQRQDKLPTARAPITPAPRTSPSSSNVDTLRSQGSRPAMATKTKTPTPAARTTAPSNSDASLIPCKTCTRCFATNRIARHEEICATNAHKRRKKFDTVGQRVKGTELEIYVKRFNKKQGKVSSSSKPEVQQSNWRRKHEDFINAIRSAKQMQVHLASGGKLSDLPPPPPSDNSDYVQCPHCSRRFNPGVADRHIPKCQSMHHNKPKPKPKR